MLKAILIFPVQVVIFCLAFLFFATWRLVRLTKKVLSYAR